MQEVWRFFGIKNLGEYHDLYLKTHVMLLADVFENFRKTCIRHYGLDPAHFYSVPGVSWDGLLKYTEANIELLSDYDMHLFTKEGVRGGSSTVGSK